MFSSGQRNKTATALVQQKPGPACSEEGQSRVTIKYGRRRVKRPLDNGGGGGRRDTSLPCRPRIALQQSDDGRIGLGSFDEFVDRQLLVAILVHLAEDFVRSLLGRRLVVWHLHY